MAERADDFGAATRLIEQHGEGAALVAQSHVSSARQRGEIGNLRRWSRILAMIEALCREPAGEDGDETGTGRPL